MQGLEMGHMKVKQGEKEIKTREAEMGRKEDSELQRRKE